MSDECFGAWPHDAEGIIQEALREFVGDGDGEDEKVLNAYRAEVRAEAWDEGAEAMEQHWAYGNDKPSNPYREGGAS